MSRGWRVIVCVLASVGGLVMLMAGGGWGQVSTAAGMGGMDQPVLRPPVQLQHIAQFRQILASKNVPANKRSALEAEFGALPADLQATLLEAMASPLPSAQLPRATARPGPEIIPPGPVIRLNPTISRFFPEFGTAPDSWVIVMGSFLQNGDKILWDGVERPTTFYGPSHEFFPNSLCFKIPAGTPLATNHEVKVFRSLNVQSAPATYRCVAPRGYRGYHGWQFSNFSAAVIPWYLYRDFFGASAVEYSNGTHKPAAQAWYDSTYKGVGSGGNCYGMSNSSLRIRNGNMTTYHRHWFVANPQPFCWFYPWRTETKESVQEDQGGQLSAEMAATINNLWNNQTHKQAWERINSLVGQLTNKPVIGFWYVGHWGHAVVGYRTEISGSQRKIYWYDNNEPYAENETGGPDNSWAYVDWNNGSFHANSYSTANKMVCMSYDECMRPPHLPTEAGGPGASTTGTVIAVVEGGQVQQIEDEQGRRFYAADGSENQDPATRIPNAMRFIPIQGAGQEYVGPAIFIFNNASNKNLLFSIAGAGEKMLSLFQPASVLSVRFAGTGQIRCNRLLTPNRNLELLNPASLQPLIIRAILAVGNQRVGEALNLNLGNAPAMFSLNEAAGGTLEVQTGAGGQFDVRMETFAANQTLQALFRNVQTQANSRALLTPTNWNALHTSSLNVNLRTLNNQPLRQLRINQ